MKMEDPHIYSIGDTALYRDDNGTLWRGTVTSVEARLFYDVIPHGTVGIIDRVEAKAVYW